MAPACKGTMSVLRQRRPRSKWVTASIAFLLFSIAWCLLLCPAIAFVMTQRPEWLFVTVDWWFPKAFCIVLLPPLLMTLVVAASD